MNNMHKSTGEITPPPPINRAPFIFKRRGEMEQATVEKLTSSRHRHSMSKIVSSLFPKLFAFHPESTDNTRKTSRADTHAHLNERHRMHARAWLHTIHVGRDGVRDGSFA